MQGILFLVFLIPTLLWGLENDLQGKMIVGTQPLQMGGSEANSPLSKPAIFIIDPAEIPFDHDAKIEKIKQQLSPQVIEKPSLTAIGLRSLRLRTVDLGTLLSIFKKPLKELKKQNKEAAKKLKIENKQDDTKKLKEQTKEIIRGYYETVRVLDLSKNNFAPKEGLSTFFEILTKFNTLFPNAYINLAGNTYDPEDWLDKFQAHFTAHSLKYNPHGKEIDDNLTEELLKKLVLFLPTEKFYFKHDSSDFFKDAKQVAKDYDRDPLSETLDNVYVDQYYGHLQPAKIGELSDDELDLSGPTVERQTGRHVVEDALEVLRNSNPISKLVERLKKDYGDRLLDIKKLDLSSNYLSDKGIGTLVDFIVDNLPNLKILNLSNNHIRSYYAYKFVPLLQQDGFRYLVILDNQGENSTYIIDKLRSSFEEELEHEVTITSETSILQDQIDSYMRKVIWISKKDLDDLVTSITDGPHVVDTHRDYYGIKKPESIWVASSSISREKSGFVVTIFGQLRIHI